jgi:hypothetical protein
MARWQQLRILTVLTAAEMLRQPICLLITIVGVVLTTMVPLMTAHNFGEPGRLARDSGLAVQLMLGLVLAGYTACATLQRERRSGTLAAVLSKPVDRWTFFIAKFLGIAAVIVIFSFCAGLSTLLAQRIAMRYTTNSGYLVDRHTAWLVMLSTVGTCAVGAWANYRRGRAFPSTAMLALPVLLALVTAICGCFTREGRWDAYHPQLQWQILVAALMVMFGLLVLASIALSLAVRLPLTPTVAICFGLLLVGLASDHLFTNVGFFYALIPNWQNFWVADAIAGGGAVSVSYLARTALYTILYTTGILCLGGAAFQHAEAS